MGKAKLEGIRRLQLVVIGRVSACLFSIALAMVPGACVTERELCQGDVDGAVETCETALLLTARGTAQDPEGLRAATFAVCVVAELERQRCKLKSNIPGPG